MTLEGAVSVWAGFVAKSLVLVVFGADSFIELVSAYAVANYLRGREKPTRNDAILHTTERFTAILLFTLIPSIAIVTVYSYLTGVRAEASTLGVAVALGAVAIMPFLWLKKKQIGVETGCLPLCIDAVESATCFFMSLALLGGLLAISLFRLWWVDYVATSIVVAFIAKEAIEVLH